MSDDGPTFKATLEATFDSASLAKVASEIENAEILGRGARQIDFEVLSVDRVEGGEDD